MRQSFLVPALRVGTRSVPTSRCPPRTAHRISRLAPSSSIRYNPNNRGSVADSRRIMSERILFCLLGIAAVSLLGFAVSYSAPASRGAVVIDDDEYEEISL